MRDSINSYDNSDLDELTKTLTFSKFKFSIGNETAYGVFMSLYQVQQYLEEHTFIPLEDKLYRTIDITKVEEIKSAGEKEGK